MFCLCTNTTEYYGLTGLAVVRNTPCPRYVFICNACGGCATFPL